MNKKQAKCPIINFKDCVKTECLFFRDKNCSILSTDDLAQVIHLIYDSVQGIEFDTFDLSDINSKLDKVNNKLDVLLENLPNE